MIDFFCFIVFVMFEDELIDIDIPLLLLIAFLGRIAGDFLPPILETAAELVLLNQDHSTQNY